MVDVMTLHARGVRQDVRELGTVLGDILADQTSASDFETVELLRTTSIEYRRGDIDSRAPVHEIVDDLSPDRQSVVARAFTTYFELINLAEERERVRVIRTASQKGTLDDGVAAAASALSDADRNTIERVLEDVVVQPTFTAHPTEARRKTVKAKLRTIATQLRELDERRLTDSESTTIDRAIAAEVTSLWQTPQLRERRPEPEDEARNVQWYLENTLFDVVREVYGELEEALADELENEVDVPRLLAFRSWAGSDRDGNPFVTSDVTKATLERQRSIVLERYREELDRLSGILSQEDTRLEVGASFERSFARDRAQLVKVADIAEDRHPNEPFRKKLWLMRERLDRVDDVRPGGYDSADGLLEDLETIARSLRMNDADVLVDTHVEPLRRTIETFGFSLASLDLRDHRANHTEAVTAALATEGIDYGSMDEDARVEMLTDAIVQDDPVIDISDREELSEEGARVLERFDALADWHAEYGEEAINAYCISMTEEVSHILEVVFLADQAGIVQLPGYCGIDIVPLLETEYALSRARHLIGTLFENKAYAPALEARDWCQEVMIGYSDSNKENGFLAANWSLYRNQRRLADVCSEYDVTLQLFHGRGGSISRGGGPMNQALQALPSDTVEGPVKFTVQGEAIAEKYSNPQIAKRDLEQMVNAQLRARLEALRNPEPETPTEWQDALATMATAAREHYRGLLESDGFVQYFEQATPITVIEDLNLGSRPASRTGERTVEDLRAIPWVFAWTQSRCILPGWYGLGTGLQTYLDQGGDVDTLQAMYHGWPFFRTTLDNAGLAMARTDMEIAAEYADLADAGLRKRFFPPIRDEYERAYDLVTTVADRDGLLQRAWLEESLHRRNPYVDPLNLLQIRLLGQSHRNDQEERTLRLTVKGIAAGMKNTG